MNKRIVVSPKNLPLRSPFYGTVLQWLVLDKLNAPGWMWGAVGVCMALKAGAAAKP